MKPTLVIGASNRPEKYAYKAVQQLVNQGHPVIAYGKNRSSIAGIQIEDSWDSTWKVDTVTLYVNPTNQETLIDAIIDLKPKRVLFNPGTENPSFEKRLQECGILAENACTLVMLSIGIY